MIKLNWFDVLMAVLAISPFAYLWADSAFSVTRLLPMPIGIFAWVIFTTGLIAFPSASILYFVWRVRESKDDGRRSNSQLDTDAIRRQST